MTGPIPLVLLYKAFALALTLNSPLLGCSAFSLDAVCHRDSRLLLWHIDRPRTISLILLGYPHTSECHT